MDVALHAPDVVVVNLHQHPIFQLAVLCCSRVQLDLTVESANLLDFSRDQIPFHVVFSDVQFVLLDSSPLNPTWKVDSRQVQNGMLVRVDIYLPAGLIDTNNAPNNDISNIGPVVAFSGTHTDHSVDQVHDASQRRVNHTGLVLRNVSSVACDVVLADVVPRNNYSHVSFVYFFLSLLVNLHPLDRL